MASLISGGCSYTYSPDPAYKNYGAGCLTDGTLNYGINDVVFGEYRDHVGSPYYGYVRIDLGSQYILDHMRFGYFVYNPAHIYAPSTVIVQANNDDGASWTDLATFTQSGNWTTDNSGINPHINRWSNDMTISGTYRYVRFKIDYNDPAASDTAHYFSEFEVYGDAPSSSSIKTINGLAKASIKTVNGLAIASVKTWNGLA